MAPGLKIQDILPADYKNDAIFQALQSLTDHKLAVDKNGYVRIETYASIITMPSGNKLIEDLINSKYVTIIEETNKLWDWDVAEAFIGYDFKCARPYFRSSFQCHTVFLPLAKQDG